MHNAVIFCPKKLMQVILGGSTKTIRLPSVLCFADLFKTLRVFSMPILLQSICFS